MYNCDKDSVDYKDFASRQRLVTLKRSTERPAHNNVLAQWPGAVSSLLSVSLFTFVSWDRSQLVGLGIPLRFIAKPSYSGHFASTHVVGNFVLTIMFY
jgi:hypothetical protein